MPQQNFGAVRPGQAISASGTTVLNGEARNFPDALVDNRGLYDAFVLFGDSTVTVTSATGVRVPAGGTAVVNKSTATHVAVAVASGSPALTLHFGEGQHLATRQGGSVAPAGSEPGQNASTDRVDVFPGGPGVTVAATGQVKAAPCGVYRIRCLTAGTITSLHDNATAASGDQLLPSTAMTQGQVIEIGESLQYGLWAVIASGTYRIVFTPNF